VVMMMDGSCDAGPMSDVDGGRLVLINSWLHVLFGRLKSRLISSPSSSPISASRSTTDTIKPTLLSKRLFPQLSLPMSQFLLLLASLLWIQFTLAEGPRVIELNVSWIKAAPDGVERDVITFNGVWPPETIRVSKDESYILKVYNGLNDSECITMHSHGIDQFGSNPYDGVDQVTQWYDSLSVISFELYLERTRLMC
jgi:FtsP/CotA-like multicopper oxidase with cupredoxin domain